jgi:hypothetical protein
MRFPPVIVDLLMLKHAAVNVLLPVPEPQGGGSLTSDLEAIHLVLQYHAYRVQDWEWLKVT